MRPSPDGFGSSAISSAKTGSSTAAETALALVTLASTTEHERHQADHKSEDVAARVAWIASSMLDRRTSCRSVCAIQATITITCPPAVAHGPDRCIHFKPPIETIPHDRYVEGYVRAAGSAPVIPAPLARARSGCPDAAAGTGTDCPSVRARRSLARTRVSQLPRPLDQTGAQGARESPVASIRLKSCQTGS